MYDRATRKTANFVVGSTRDNVGPGSYDIPLPRYIKFFGIFNLYFIQGSLNYSA